MVERLTSCSPDFSVSRSSPGTAFSSEPDFKPSFLLSFNFSALLPNPLFGSADGPSAPLLLHGGALAGSLSALSSPSDN